MNQDEIPLEIRPRDGAPPRSLHPASEPLGAVGIMASEELVDTPGLMSLPAPFSLHSKEGSVPSPMRSAETFPLPSAVPGSPGPEHGERNCQENDPPVALTPTREPRIIEDRPHAERRASAAREKRSLGPRLLGPVVGVAALVTVSLWLARAIRSWGDSLTVLHPALAYALYGSVGVLLAFVLVTTVRQYRAYKRLTVVGNLRVRLEQARNGQVSKGGDDHLRQEFQAHLEQLHTAQIISDDLRRSVLMVLREPHASGGWVERSGQRLLRGMDDQAKQEIEREARLVGVSTALSPSGPLDTALVLWRGTRLILRVAQIYGMRPGGYSSYFLFRRVVVHMGIAGLSEEAMQMLSTAYGPAAAEAAAKGLRGLFDLMSKGGLLLAPVEPLTGGLLAMGGVAGKGASDAAGAAVTLVSGPLLQGVLNGILTLRIGQAAQHECRLLAMTSQERRRQAAGAVSALLGFFRSVRQAPYSPAQSAFPRGQA